MTKRPSVTSPDRGLIDHWRAAAASRLIRWPSWRHNQRADARRAPARGKTKSWPVPVASAGRSFAGCPRLREGDRVGSPSFFSGLTRTRTRRNRILPGLDLGKDLFHGPHRVGAGGLKAAAGLHSQVAQWIRDGRIVAAHDVSDGGVAVTVAEMCIAGRLGARIRFDGGSGESVDDLFDTWMGAYVLECADASVDLNLNGGGKIELVHLGTVDDTGRLEITRANAEKVTWALGELEQAWQGSWENHAARASTG